MPLVNICRYPGILGFESATYTCSIGISPSQVIINAFPPFSGVANHGDVELSDGQWTIRIPDCARVSTHGEQAGSPTAIAIVLLDHRWRWAFGEISERWNIPEQRTNTVPLVPKPNQPGQPPGTPKPDPPGTEPIKPSTKKSARELAKRCLRAMGEQNYRVDALPDDAYPTVNWDAANPAQALQSLVDQFGCVVVWRNVERAVWICKRGEGEQLPGGAFLAKGEQVDSKPLPSMIRLLGARIRYQQRWPLEAVGRDFDGSIQPLWALSYRPDDGDWTKVHPPFFGNLGTNLPGSRTDYDAKAAAKASVYRMYRIKTPDSGELPTLTVPPDSKEKSAKKKPEQIRPLPFLNQTTRDDLGRYVQAPARCVGIHTPLYSDATGNVVGGRWQTTNVHTPVQSPFTIDAEQRLVVFSDYVVTRKSDGKIYEPEIVLECAAEVTGNDTNQFERYVRELKLLGGLDTEPAILLREDLVYEVTAEYSGDDNEYSKVITNLREIDRKAQYLLLGEVPRYQLEGAQNNVYPGLLPIGLDGAITQVTWAVGGGTPSNPSTHASRNAEHNLYLPSYEGRRRLEETDLNSRRRTAELLKALAAGPGEALGTELIAV